MAELVGDLQNPADPTRFILPLRKPGVESLQVDPFDVFHHDVGPPAFQPRIVDCHNVRVFEVREHSRFATESFDQPRLIVQVEVLDHHLSGQDVVERKVHLAQKGNA